MSRIEINIEELEQYIDNCKYSPLSSTKILVNKDELLDLIDTLKRNVPDEIKKYQRIISNRDAILRDAQDKAEEMIKKANEMTSQLVSEHEVMQQAYKEANIIIENATIEAGQIIDKATAEANGIREAAMQYTDDSLSSIESLLSQALNDLSGRFEGITTSLASSLDVTVKNRRSLVAQDEPEDEYKEYEEYDLDEPEEAAEPEEEEAETENEIEASYPASDDMSVEDAVRQGQVDINYEELRYGDKSKDELTDFNLDINDF